MIGGAPFGAPMGLPNAKNAAKMLTCSTQSKDCESDVPSHLLRKRDVDTLTQ